MEIISAGQALAAFIALSGAEYLLQQSIGIFILQVAVA